MNGIEGLVGSFLPKLLSEGSKILGGGGGGKSSASPLGNLGGFSEIIGKVTELFVPVFGGVASAISQALGGANLLGADPKALGGAIPGAPAAGIDTASALGALGGPSSASEAASVKKAGTYANPTLPINAPDPAVIRGDDGMYYAFTTQSDGKNIPVMKSKDMTKWEPAGDALPTLPSWVSKDTWAPQTVKTGDHYTLFFSGRGHDGKMRIGYATSKSPAGPFEDKGILLQSDNPGYTIDPNIFQENGKTYIYWGSADGNRAAGVGGIRAQEISVKPDGKIELKGSAVEAKPKLPADRQLVEAPWVIKHDNKYYMFYSDGHFEGQGANDYALNVAVADSPLGPFKESRRVIGAAGKVFGPGHASIVKDDAGTDWVVYHARINDPKGPRQMMMDKIEWKDGWPVVNGGKGPSTDNRPGPVVKN